MTDNFYCILCKHYLKNNTCKAFPKGIPEVILTGKDAHVKPLKDQGNSVVFEENKIRL